MSTASQTISSQLVSPPSIQSLDTNTCTVYTARIILWFSFFIIICCVLSSLYSHIMINKMQDEVIEDTLSYRHPIMLHKRGRRCRKQMPIIDLDIEKAENIENFDNVHYVSYTDSNVFNVQSVPLNAPIQEGGNLYSNLTFGQTIRHIIINNDVKKVLYNITANLYVLDGNIYDQATDKLQQTYTVQLSDDKNTITLGELKKDGDGIYKLNFESDNIEQYKNYKHIQVVYKRGDSSEIMLTGHFK